MHENFSQYKNVHFACRLPGYLMGIGFREDGKFSLTRVVKHQLQVHPKMMIALVWKINWLPWKSEIKSEERSL